MIQHGRRTEYLIAILVSIVQLIWLTTAAFANHRAAAQGAKQSSCAKCHEGIEWIRDPDSQMMQQVRALGRQSGDPHGGTVCHGGDPAAEEKEAAHRGKHFSPDPGSPWINAETCGKCHKDHVRVQWNSPMMTEAGKIQGTAWAFGTPTVPS